VNSNAGLSLNLKGQNTIIEAEKNNLREEKENNNTEKQGR
jgi:hypothetical protein